MVRTRTLAPYAAPGPEPVAAGSRREEGKQRNRDRLYDAALDLFASQGYDQVSVDDICARAGVGRATFFRLYGNKAGFFLEFNRRLARQARAAVVAAEPVDASEALRVAATSMCASWLESGAGLRDLARAYLQDVSVEVGAREGQPDLRALFSEIVAEGQRRGELVSRPGPEFTSWMIVAALSGAIATWLGSSETLTRRCAQVIDVLLRGLEAR
jgi:AcrR family transcriptional regulator